jgi:hypothetical protein
MKNKIYCEMSAKERLKEAWRDGMLYKFYAWLFKKEKKKQQNDKQ